VAAYRAIKTLFVVGLIVGAPGYARAQGQGVGVVTTLVGEATVTRAAMAPDQVLKKRDDVFPKDLISTKERSLVHVLMGGKALLTVRELSVLTVTEEAGRATVNLQSGKVGLAVVRERMRPGEVIEVHTPHAVAAVRGTVLVVEIVPGSAIGDKVDAGGTSTNVYLLHGKLDVSLRSNPAAPPVQLESFQSVSVSSNTLGTIQPLSPAASASVTASLQPPQPTRTALPEEFRSALVEQQRVLAVATVEGAAGNGTVRTGQGTQAWAAKGKADERGGGRASIDVVSDAGDGVGAGSGNAFEAGNGGGNDGANGSGGGGGRANGGSNGGSNGGGGSGNGGGNGSGGLGNGGGNGNGRGNGFGSGPGLTSVLSKFLHKKGK
jgi:hypothetical protein